MTNMEFTKRFKQKAIKLKEEGMHPKDIFEKYGYDISNKQKYYTGKLISTWKKAMPHVLEKDTKKKMEYLEAQVAYLQAENEFLRQLPKKKKN